MVKIILESCIGSELAVVITEFGTHNWCIAACADRDTGAQTFEEGVEGCQFDDRMALNITKYALQSGDQVLVNNVTEDDRFADLSTTYATNNPQGKAVIALPINQANRLLGVLQIEGKPQTFTQKNFTVLRLICNQIGISLANSFLFEEARKASAANAAMVEAQKSALAQAREAEQKAKVAEAEAKRNAKLKEDAAKAKSIFLANISHDLRTPMNGVIGLSELLKGTELNADQDAYVDSIRVCADTLLRLINDILDFSKLEAGKMIMDTVALNLRETIAEVVRALRYTNRFRNLETIEDLNGVSPDLVVIGDPVRLRQIFMNLLSNAYKFTPKGSITVRAETQEREDGKVYLTSVIADTGIGIYNDQASRLFRPFSQADSSTERSYGGSGLGLSICKAIIENVLGGKITLESEPGVGTTVVFTVPFTRPYKDDTAPRSDPRDRIFEDPVQAGCKGSAPDLRSIPRSEIRVCVAEDNPINQKIAIAFLGNMGLKGDACSNGQLAVEALREKSRRQEPYHLVLMDVQMPVLDGYNATRVIREDEDPDVRDVLVIAMTASAIDGDREKCIGAGMNNYLAKPVRFQILSRMLDQYLAPMKDTSKPEDSKERKSTAAPETKEVSTEVSSQGHIPVPQSKSIESFSTYAKTEESPASTPPESIENSPSVSKENITPTTTGGASSPTESSITVTEGSEAITKTPTEGSMTIREGRGPEPKKNYIG